VPLVAPALDEPDVIAELELARSFAVSDACSSPWLFCRAASAAADGDPAVDGLGG